MEQKQAEMIKTGEAVLKMLNRDKEAQESATRKLERFCELPLLAVDEIDAAKMSEWSEETRRRIFDARYRDAVAKRTHTVFAMNCAPKDLPGDLYDRIRDGRFVVYHNADPSARPMMGEYGKVS